MVLLRDQLDSQQRIIVGQANWLDQAALRV
jgi:hypothetical protein